MRSWHGGDLDVIDAEDLEALVDSAKRYEKQLAKKAKEADKRGR